MPAHNVSFDFRSERQIILQRERKREREMEGERENEKIENHFLKMWRWISKALRRE